MIAIILKTYCRPEVLQQCIQSILEYCDLPYRIYIADDSPINQQPLKMYEMLVREGHFVQVFEDRISVTYARNLLVEQLQDEQYVLRIDDDFLFTKNTSLEVMIDVLNSIDKIGAVSSIEKQLGDGKGVKDGELSDKQGYFFNYNRILYKVSFPVDAIDWMLTENGNRYACLDFTRNFLLIKRSVLDKVKWREELVIQGEHSAFMLDLKRAGYLLAQTPDSVHFHDERMAKSQSYINSRRSREGINAMQTLYSNAYDLDGSKTYSIVGSFKDKDLSLVGVTKILINRLLRVFKV